MRSRIHSLDHIWKAKARSVRKCANSQTRGRPGTVDTGSGRCSSFKAYITLTPTSSERRSKPRMLMAQGHGISAHRFPRAAASASTSGTRLSSTPNFPGKNRHAPTIPRRREIPSRCRHRCGPVQDMIPISSLIHSLSHRPTRVRDLRAHRARSTHASRAMLPTLESILERLLDLRSRRHFFCALFKKSRVRTRFVKLAVCSAGLDPTDTGA